MVQKKIKKFHSELLLFLFILIFLFVQAHLPFAVVGSVEEVKVGNKTVRARQYPWGVVQGKSRHEAQQSLLVCLSFTSKHN